MKDDATVGKGGDATHGVAPCRNARGGVMGARYRAFMAGGIGCCALGVAWGALAGGGRTGALYGVAAGFFLALAGVAVLWGRFVAEYLGFGGKAERVLGGYGVGLIAFHLAALGANSVGGGFFAFDAQGGCRIGGLGVAALWGVVGAVALVGVFALAKARASRDALHRRSLLVLVFCIAMAGTVGLQAVWPPGTVAALGCLAGIGFFHVFAVQEEQAERHAAALGRSLARARTEERVRSQFFSIASHDIRTPLNAILGYAELLRQGIDTPGGREEALDAIRASGTTLLQLVNDVLDLSKMDAGKLVLRPEPVRLSRLADEVFASFRMAADGKGLALVNRTAEVPAVLLDGHRVRQILFNLVGNAVKFTERGSVAVSASLGGEGLEVAVADTGCGIPRDMLEHVLDPFVQVQDPSHAADRAKGSGLGLAICRSMVKAMGGTLEVESEQGRGSVFRIRIPGVAVASEELAVPAAPEPAPAAAELPERVLVVDDSPVNRAVLAAFLKRAGVAEIDHAAEGGEALAKLDAAAREGRPCGFVFTDFWMPDTNGLEFVEKLRADARFRDLPVFAVTADTEARHDPRSRLFTGILHKPLAYGRLLEALAACAPAAETVTSGGAACSGNGAKLPDESAPA